MKNRNFFSKIAVKDYNNELEKVLEKKKFSIDAKNLLLSMLYKIELGYQDYKIIKKTSITQSQIIENILEIIENKCEKIELVEPNSKKGKILAKFGIASIENATYKTIICYPIEKEILYALYNLETNNFKVNNNYYIVNKTLPAFLKIGSNMDKKEIIRDFTGWSWNIEAKDIENFECNLIYQNLRILLRSEFLYEWYSNNNNENDYLNKMKKTLQDNYGQIAGENIYEEFLDVSILISLNMDKKMQKRIFDEKHKIESQTNLMLDKPKFLNEMTAKKRQLNLEIGEIDKTLNSKELMTEKLKKQTKAFSLSDLEVILKEKRKNLINLLDEYTELMNPKQYVKNIDELERKSEILQKISDETLSKEFINEKIIKLQTIFLNCLKNKVENTKIKTELIELIYHLRYYKSIPINNELRIGEVENLRKIINNLEETLIVKLINMKALNTLTKNDNYNVSIVKKIVNTKIIDIEKIQLEIKPKYNKLEINVYDGEILEDKFEIVSNNSIQKLGIKQNKKIKLFI